MKRLSLLTLVIVIIISTISIERIYSQNHYSMLEGNPEWVYHYMPPSESRYKSNAYGQCSYPNEMYLRLYVNGDTVHLNNHTYYIVYYEGYNASGSLIDGHYFWYRQNPGIYTALRESDGKTFAPLYGSGMRFTKRVLVDNSKYDTNEVMIFDNDIQKGDTVYECSYYTYSLDPSLGTRTEVPIIGDTLIQVADGSMRRMLTYGCKNDNDQLQYMIESIGFINPDNMPVFAVLEETQVHVTEDWMHYCNLLLFRQNGKVVYISPRCKDDASYEEKAMSFAPMPFYPGITPESVADGTYTLPAAVDGIAEYRKSKGKQVYNLQGQKTNGPQRGINIVGGKKVIVK